MKCLSIESRIITCSSVSVDSLLLALSRIRRWESLFALLFVMESKYIQREIMFLPSNSGVSLQVHAVCASPPAPLKALVLAAASVTVSLMRAVHGKRDGKANRPFCSRVMKERRVVMKERAIPGACNCCPRGPRIQYCTVWASPYGLIAFLSVTYIYIYIYTNIQFRHSTPRLHASR